ncbi:MAG: peptidoglycan editing factor PgeF [Clostridium sp.]|nr:peptidoglycan editing factor PgeF [Clostridium sp.]
MLCVNYDLGPGVGAFSTLRGIEPGDSECPFAGFSVCGYTGDDSAHTACCLDEFSAAVPGVRLLLPRQTHSTAVAVVTSETDAGDFAGVDALVTASPRVALGIQTADCVPILLADPEARVIAAAHAGWRGTVGGIAAATLRQMIELGARPGRIRVAIGPSICRDCFEVGEEVASRFPGSVVDRSGAKPHVDLEAANRDQLLSLGVLPENIALRPACSRCNPAGFFSARRLGISSGRTLSVVWLC